MAKNAKVDIESGSAEVYDLWSATTADELHQVLVLRPPVRASADSFEPFYLLSKHHEAEPSTSIKTALLLLTDSRWRNGVGQLVRRIADSDILKPDELDLLAQTFAAADHYVYWQTPDNWWSDDVIVIDLRDEAVKHVEEPSDSSDEPTVLPRPVYPPLRRWASSWLVRRDPTGWGNVYARTRQLDGAASAALMSGLLDVAASLTSATQQFLLEAALGWPNQAVRFQGLKWLADRKGAAAAHARGKDDPNARIRSWAKSLLDDPPSAAATPDDAHQPPPVRREPTRQPPLF